jgi:hypothetical protein
MGGRAGSTKVQAPMTKQIPSTKDQTDAVWVILN